MALCVYIQHYQAQKDLYLKQLQYVGVTLFCMLSLIDTLKEQECFNTVHIQNLPD